MHGRGTHHRQACPIASATSQSHQLERKDTLVVIHSQHCIILFPLPFEEELRHREGTKCHHAFALYLGNSLQHLVVVTSVHTRIETHDGNLRRTDAKVLLQGL